MTEAAPYVYTSVSLFANSVRRIGMMTANEIVEAVLNGARIFASWPVLAFIMVWIFRKQIGDLLPALARRLGKVTIGGSIFEFGSEELRGTTVREEN